MDETSGEGAHDSSKATTVTEGDASSFKMSRKSAAASRLKALVSDKLRHFLDDYSDDVLAEYITVLVCNGKNQHQAREDLEAFLGVRSREFVAWLWELLLKKLSLGDEDSFVSDQKDAADSSPHTSCADKGSRINKSRDSKHITDPIYGAMAKVEKKSEPSVSACTDAPPENVKSCEGSQHCKANIPLHEVDNMKVLQPERREDVLKRTGATETYNRSSSTNECRRKISSTVIPSYREEGAAVADKSKKTFHKHLGELKGQLLHLPKGEPKFNPQHASSGRVLSAGPADIVSHQKGKPQISVWDRLGKPSNDSSVSCKSTVVPGIGVAQQEKKVFHQYVPTFPVPNSEHSWRSVREVPVVGKMCNSFQSLTHRELGCGITAASEPLTLNNMRRKRHFGEGSSNDDSVSVDLGGNGNMDLRCKELSRAFKKPNLIVQESATPNLLAEVLDVKQKLLKIEMEMFKLRSKRLEKEKDQKPVFLPDGELKHRQEDIESRTVYVTNVHFAATKEAITLFFATCGVVEYVMILTDQATCKPRGAAFVTFASKESADNAISLSGSKFYSRMVKVLRKAEAAPGTATAAATLLPHINRNPLSRKGSHYSRHLQWRREATFTPSGTSAPASTRGRATSQLNCRV